MKGSSLGARLFEGLVQPILGSLWNSPPTTIEKTGDPKEIDSTRQTRVQRPVSSVQPTSGYAGLSAMRGYACQEGNFACENGVSHVAIPDRNSTHQHPKSVHSRPVGSGNKLVQATVAGAVHQTAGGSPQTAQGRFRRKQTRVAQRQTLCRYNESAQGTRKDATEVSVVAANQSRRVIRHRTGALPVVSVCTIKSQRARQHKGDRRRKSTVTQTAVRLREKLQCASAELHSSSVEREGSHRSLTDVRLPQSAAEAHTVVKSQKWDNSHLRSNGDGDGIDHVRSGHGSAHLSGGDDLQNFSKCNNDCSSSSTWGSDGCLFTSANNSHLFPIKSSPTDIRRDLQASLTTSMQCEQQRPKKEQQCQCLKQQAHQAQLEPRVLEHAMSVEEDSCDTRLHSWQSAAPAKGVVPMETSCASSSEATSCRPQCSDTTTTCSSSMTSCGDARDTATGSAATTSEHAQHYLDIDEQTPLTFPSTTTREPFRTLCQEGGAASLSTLDDSHLGAVQHSSLLDGSSGISSFTAVSLAAHTSSRPPSSLAFASSISSSAAPTQSENRIFANASSHSSSIASHAHQEEATAGTSCGNTSNHSQGGYMPHFSCSKQRQLYHLQNAATTVTPSSTGSSVNLRVAGHQEDNPTSTTAREASVADDKIRYKQREQQQSRQAEGSAAGSVIFGHRVLKPLRSKSLEENYDALVEIVAFTKRRCEKETMELLRKDLHILYYARGLHHAAHVETYLQQQQNQKCKPRQGKKSSAASGNDSTIVPSKMLCGGPGPSSATGSAPCGTGQNSQLSSAVPASTGTTHPPYLDNKGPAAPFPSVSAALASGARPHPVPDWATPGALRTAMERQQCYDPFSIFGEAPPELLLSEVYDEQHYTHISPQTRASHPVLARLKHQRRAALMAVFQQKSATLTRTLQQLEHELGQLQLQQRYSSQQQTPQEHETSSSIISRVVASCGGGGGATSKADTSRIRDQSPSSLQLKGVEEEERGECKSISHRETILRLKHRGVLSQHSLLEKRLQLQLQQEEMIHSEMLRNGFHFFDIRASGGVCGAVLFRKRVLPALESWWQQQCQVELDWRNDPLTSEECCWYREVMNAAVDASDLISVQQACFCPTPPPYRQWAWTDCRFRQRKQHEQKLAKQRQELQQLSAENRDGHHMAIEWENAEPNAARGGAKAWTGCQADRCPGGEKALGALATDIAEHSSNGGTLGGHIRGENAEEIVNPPNCDEESDTASEETKRNGQFTAVRTPTRRGRKRRAKGECAPQALVENKADAEGSERDIELTSNSGSARKRPRSFCRQARRIQFHYAQAERPQSLQSLGECCSSRGCTCGIRHPKTDNSGKRCHSSVAETTTLLSEPVSGATVGLDKHAHALNVHSSCGVANTLWEQAPCNWNEERGNEIAGPMRPCNETSKANQRSGLSSLPTPPGVHELSTPVARMQALKLSKQQRTLPTAPLQHAQQRSKAVEAGRHQQLQRSVLAPSNNSGRLRRLTTPHESEFTSPTPAGTSTNTAGGHLSNVSAGNGHPDAAARSAWKVDTGIAEAVEAATAAGGTGCCGGGAGRAEHCSTATRGPPDGISSTADENRCRPGRTIKHMKLNTSHGLLRQFQKQLITSTRTLQEGCLPTRNMRPTGLSVPVTGTHSRLANASVRELTEGEPPITEPGNTRLPGKNIINREISISKSLYPCKSSARPATLLPPRCARLSIDRVYGCRRTSDFFHRKNRSQFVLGSLVRPATTSSTYCANDCRIIADGVRKKDIECMNNEVP